MPKKKVFKNKYFNKLNQYFTGYSLIEVLVSISIMAILVGLGYTNLRGYQQKKQLDNAVDIIKADLTLARESALAGKKPTNASCNTRTLEGYRFIKTASAKYELSVGCVDGTGSYWTKVKEVDLSKLNVTIADFNPSNAIIFYPVAKGTNITVSTGSDIVINQNGTSNNITVTVLPGGEIH